MKQLYVKTRTAWRKWLAENHDKEPEVWLVFYKKHTCKPSLKYDVVVEEALCYGWIDSIVKKIDEERYAQKITPRKRKSRWSESNINRVAQLTKQGRMANPGLAAVEQAKKAGLWKPLVRPNVSFEISAEFERALGLNKKARTFFDQLAPTYQKQFIGWIAVAKRSDTKGRRIKESIVLLAKEKKLGLK